MGDNKVMKITTLIENTEDENRMLINEHGLSIFIESSNGNILFDTGQSGDFIKNAEKLDIDLRTVDALVLSHAHYDHCGGVKRLLETYNIKPQLIVGSSFFGHSQKYHYYPDKQENERYKYIGPDFDENYIRNKGLSIKFIKNRIVKINEQVYVFTNFKRVHKFERDNAGMVRKTGSDEYITDTFDDEISMGLKTDEGFVVLLGCAHPGFLNIIDSISEVSGQKIAGVIGGTHLGKSDEQRINKSADYLTKLDIKMLGLSHCTGEKAAKVFNEKCRGTFTNRTGTFVEL